MFRLKKLDIHGFKSFVDKVTVTLPSRITAIVGPNGSGKSNICDAVQWVLGEQRASVLRGTTMDDVIFNGSARRRPMGLAEVTLTLEARGDHWKETGGEVVITRRVHRDGESDYLLNGKRSRLKDIQEILMGTGLGVRAYSIIEQQKIDLILSTKPQDRRRLIEEASGISKYKMRKRQAELKLEETRSNLLRLTDIVSEIERTCTSLKRQAGRAARWKEQADVLAALKKKLSRLRADRLTDALVAAEATLLAANEREAAAMADLVARDAEATDDRRRADEDERQGRALSEALAKAREALLAAEAAVATAEKDVDEGRARQQLLIAQQREAESDHVRSAEESARGQELLEEVDRSLGTAEEKAREAAQASRRPSARKATPTPVARPRAASSPGGGTAPPTP
jgi:chromosome segregation protein